MDFFKKIDDFILSMNKNYPGQKNKFEVQILKGIIRETEEERVWILSKDSIENVIHLRSGFYKGNFFDPTPSHEIDVMPLADLIEKNNYDIITVAFDPESTGPDTHYKVLQVLSEALKVNQDQDPMIIGYRNVWHRFSFDDANILYPVSEEDLSDTHSVFMSCYQSQKNASFPCHLHDGLFSELAQKMQVEQLNELKILLGDDFFKTHKIDKIKNAKGLVLLKKMTKDEFLSSSDDLKKKIELDL